MSPTVGATFSTILNKLYPDDQALIDQALAHAGKGKVEAAYNRAQHLNQMRGLFQRWADLIAPQLPALPAPVDSSRAANAIVDCPN